MIVVLSAAGYTGRRVVAAVAARGLPVRGMVRDPRAASTVQAAGATEVVVGDPRDLTSVAGAMHGVDGVFFAAPRFLPAEAALSEAVIDLAEQAGARRFVLSGVYHPSLGELVNHAAKQRAEARLYTSGLEFTVLQPARFMHGLLLSSRDRILSDGVLADAFRAEVAMAYVDYRDVAEVAALAFGTPDLVGGTFELSAPGQPTLHEIATTLSKVLGRPIRAQHVPLSDYAPAACLLTNPYAADGFRRLRDHYDRYGFPGGNALVLRTILGREPHGFGAAWHAMSDEEKPPRG